MFETTAEGFTWLRSPSGRSKRTTTVRTGCFVLEHEATGKIITFTSEEVSLDVDLTLLAISDENHRCKAFVKLCKDDSVIRVYEYPTRTIKQAKLIEKEIRQSTTPNYLLLN